MFSFESRVDAHWHHRLLGCMCRVVVLIAVSLSSTQVRSESAVELLAGFDAARLEGTVDATGAIQTDEIAKLLFRVKVLDPASLEARVGPLDPSTVAGNVVRVSGTVVAVEPITVPEPLVEFLEFARFYRVDIAPAIDAGEQGAEATPAASADSLQQVYLVTLPSGIAAGDTVSAAAVFLRGLGSQGPSSLVAVASRLSWKPAEAPSPGWALLGAKGVDISSVSQLQTRNRRPLSSDDSDAFYSMLAAAEAIAKESPAASEQVEAERVEPADLLKRPEEWIGDWIRLKADTVRITRIAVTDPAEQRQLGAKEYFQVDAIGDLGNVVIQLERKEGEPVRFENRYPVSIVVTRLPDFLADRMRNEAGQPIGVGLVSSQIEVTGFFFRLWSYENERMSQDGKGEQIGPLVVGSILRNVEVTGSDPVGVSNIGKIAAMGVLAAIILTLFWARRNRKSDAAAKQTRQAKESKDLDWLAKDSHEP